MSDMFESEYTYHYNSPPGGMTGYAAGIDKKMKLLKIEGIII